MTDEIMRNILTAGTAKRRMRFYGATVDVANASPVGFAPSAIISFEQGRHFLATGIQCSVNNTNGVEGVAGNFAISLSRLNSGKRYYLTPAQIVDVCPISFNLNDQIPGSQYLYFDGNDNLQLTVHVKVATVIEQFVRLNLCGIEYLPAA